MSLYLHPDTERGSSCSQRVTHLGCLTNCGSYNKDGFVHNHSGFCFYIVQLVRVKAHQEPPHSRPCQQEGVLTRYVLAWIRNTPEKEETEECLDLVLLNREKAGNEMRKNARG